MPITRISKYRCSDGKEFPDAQAASQHEASLKFTEWLRPLLPSSAEVLAMEIKKAFVLTPRKGWEG